MTSLTVHTVHILTVFDRFMKKKMVPHQKKQPSSNVALLVGGLLWSGLVQWILWVSFIFSFILQIFQICNIVVSKFLKSEV